MQDDVCASLTQEDFSSYPLKRESIYVLIENLGLRHVCKNRKKSMQRCNEKRKLEASDTENAPCMFIDS